MKKLLIASVLLFAGCSSPISDELIVYEITIKESGIKEVFIKDTWYNNKYSFQTFGKYNIGDTLTFLKLTK